MYGGSPQRKALRRRISLDRVNGRPQNEHSRGRPAQRRGSPNRSIQHARPLQRNQHTSSQRGRPRYSRSQHFQDEERSRHPTSQHVYNNAGQRARGHDQHLSRQPLRSNNRLRNPTSHHSQNNGRVPQHAIQSSRNPRAYHPRSQPYHQPEDKEDMNENRDDPYHRGEDENTLRRTLRHNPSTLHDVHRPYNGHERAQGFQFPVQPVAQHQNQELRERDSLDEISRAEQGQAYGYAIDETNLRHLGVSHSTTESEQVQGFRLGDLEEQTHRSGSGARYPQNSLRPQGGEMAFHRDRDYSIRTNFGPGPDLKPISGSAVFSQDHEILRSKFGPKSSVVPGLYQSSHTRDRVLYHGGIDLSAAYDSSEVDGPGGAWPSENELTYIHSDENDEVPREDESCPTAVPRQHSTIRRTQDADPDDINEDLYEMGERLIGNDIGIDYQPNDGKDQNSRWYEWAAMTGGRGETAREGSPPREEPLPQEQSLPKETSLLQEVPLPQESSQTQEPDSQELTVAQPTIFKDHVQRFLCQQGDQIDTVRARTPEGYQRERQVRNFQDESQWAKVSPAYNDDSKNWLEDSMVPQNTNDAIARRDEASTIPIVVVGFDDGPYGNFAKASVIKKMASNATISVKKSFQGFRHISPSSIGEQTCGYSISNMPAQISDEDVTRAFIGDLGRGVSQNDTLGGDACVIPQNGEVGASVPSRAKEKLVDLSEASKSTANYSNPNGLIAEERVMMYKNAQRKAALQAKTEAEANAETQVKPITGNSNGWYIKNKSVETHPTRNGMLSGQKIHDQQMASTLMPRTDTHSYRMATGQAESHRHRYRQRRRNDRGYIDESQHTQYSTSTHQEGQYAPNSYAPKSNTNANARSMTSGRAVSNGRGLFPNHGSAKPNSKAAYPKYSQRGYSNAKEGFMTSNTGSRQAEHGLAGFHGTYDALQNIPNASERKLFGGMVSRSNEFQTHDSMSPVRSQISRSTMRSRKLGHAPVMQNRTRQEKMGAEMLLSRPVMGGCQPFGVNGGVYSAPISHAKYPQSSKPHLPAGRQNMLRSKPSMVSGGNKYNNRKFKQYDGGDDGRHGGEDSSFGECTNSGSHASLVGLSGGRLDIRPLSPTEPHPKPSIKYPGHEMYPASAISSATNEVDHDYMLHSTRMAPRSSKLHTADHGLVEASLDSEYRNEEGDNSMIGLPTDPITSVMVKSLINSPYGPETAELRERMANIPQPQDDRNGSNGSAILAFIADSAQHTDAAWNYVKEARRNIYRPVLSKIIFRRRILMVIYELGRAIQSLEETFQFEGASPGNAFGTHSTKTIHGAFNNLAQIVDGLASALSSFANEPKFYNVLNANTTTKLVHRLQAHVGVFDSFMNRNCRYFDPRFLEQPGRAKIGFLFNSVNKMEAARRNWERVRRDKGR